MSAEFAQRFDPSRAGIRPMTVAALDGVVALETLVYPFPWSRGNFVDTLVAGYAAWTLTGSSGELIGYCIAMRGVEEMHLLNITVAPPSRRRGHARRMLGELVRLCRSEDARRLWLEVRESNAEARATYVRLGFSHVGVRKGYYPAPEGRREDAVVMSLAINDTRANDALD
ncbi:MAG: ribosomal protein S18-alanine N-acetyltransferase [Pseudomonadota bacterium]|nr:ribosomal protein S18-alanine N-acetyltransferase [Pseudomonadota bacterium]